MAQTWPLFVYFRPFLNTNTVQSLTTKSVDGVLGTRTRGGRMVGVDESTELLRHPRLQDYFITSDVACKFAASAPAQLCHFMRSRSFFILHRAAAPNRR